jgi:ATP-dependent Clp protease adapter protein ClpS
MVTRYIYATADVEVPYLLRKSERADAWSSKSNWIGYVAVCVDEKEIQRLGRRDILIVWRGTVTGLEWAANLTYRLIPCKLTDEMKHGESTHIKVEAGFQSLYTSAKDDSRFNKISAQSYLTKGLQDLIDEHKDDGHELSITITGHSLGSALATLSAYDLAEAELNLVEVGGRKVTIPITVFSFAGPRVGNGHFKDRVEELGIKVLRVVNKGDIVPYVPGFQILEYFQSSYHHVGEVLHVNDEESKYLDQAKASLWSLENLEKLTAMAGTMCGPQAGILCW